MATTKGYGEERIDNVNDVDQEKNAAARQTSIYDEETLKIKAEEGDYSGARKKTDPVEIKLVKKLDWYIMPM